MVRKQIHEDKPISHSGPGSSIMQISDSPLSEESMSHHFLKKFIISSFDCYTRDTNPVQHPRAYQVKTAVRSHDVPLMFDCFLSISRA